MTARVPAAGYRSVVVTDGDTGVPIRTPVFFPSLGTEQPTSLGPFTETVARDGERASTCTGLVVISHGTGSMPMLHRGLAIALARAGYVVAVPEHPGNSRADNSLAGTEANLRNRPGHLRAVIDWAFGNEAFGRALPARRVAAIGHSLGAYTVLALAGGRPTAFPWEATSGAPTRIDVPLDERVTAVVLLAPAVAWFVEAGALSDVRVPTLMLTGEKDDLEIPGEKTLPDGRIVFMPAGHSALVLRDLGPRGLVDHRVIPNASHYSFLTPYPAAMTSPALAPSQDPPGFARAPFYAQMCSDVAAFLDAHVPVPAR